MDSQGKGLIKALENWAKKVTSGYRDVDVRDMSSSFRDGLAFCAIIHKYRPDLIDFDSLSKENILQNNQLAFSVAEKQLGVPALLDAEDMVQYAKPDRLSIITYLSQLHNCFENQNKVRSGFKRIQNNNTSGPPSKISATEPKLLSAKRIEVCQECKNRVFILERLIVDGKLYHTTCFKCCKCSSLLNPGAYIESDISGQYECSVCLPDEKANGMETDDSESFSSLEEKSSPLNPTKNSSHHIKTNFISKSPLSEVVTKARSSFLENSLSSRTNGVSLSNSEGMVSTSDKKTSSIEDLHANGVSVKSKISVFESNNFNKSSESKSLELPATNKLKESPSTATLYLTSSNKSPRPSIRTSLISPQRSEKISQKSTEETTDSTDTSQKEVTDISNSHKTADNLNTSKSLDFASNISEESSKSVSGKTTDSVDTFQKGISDISNSHKTFENLNTSKSLDFASNISEESSKSTPNEMPTINISNSPSSNLSNSLRTLSKRPQSSTFRKSVGEYQSPLKASRDIFQTNIQPLKLTIPTINSSVSTKDSNSLPTSFSRSLSDKSPEVAQMKSTNSRTLPRPLSFSNLPNKNKIREKSESTSNVFTKSLDLTPRRRSLESNKNDITDGRSNFDYSLKTDSKLDNMSSYSEVKNKELLLKRKEIDEKPINTTSVINKTTPIPLIRLNIDSKKSEIKEKSELQAITKILSSKEKLSEDPTSKIMPGKSPFSEDSDSVPESLPEPPPSATPTKEVDESYPGDLNPFGDDVDKEEEYPDDLNPFGDDNEEPPKVFEGVSADNYDESKNPFASDEEEAELCKTPSPKQRISQNSSPFTGVSSPTGSLRGTTKKRQAPKPPRISDIFPSDSLNDSSRSLKASPAVSRKSMDTPSPKLRKNKPAPPPPPVPSPRQTLQSDSVTNAKIAENTTNGQIKSAGVKTSPKELRKKKRPAPPVPIPKRKDNKKIPLKEILREMKDIEAKQREFEKQGREIELLIRDRDKDEEPSVEEEEYIMQLFELVNQKNALFRRQAELMYIKRSQRLEEQQEELEKQIRKLMEKPNSEKTDEDRTKEEELIYELTDIVDQRNSIIDSIEMDRRRELEEDVSVQEQVEIKNGDLPIAAELKEKSKSKVKKEKKKKEKKEKKEKKKDKNLENGETGKITLRKKLFK